MICRDYGDRARLDAVDTRLVESVAEHGWGVVMIGAQESNPGWAFTVGLWHSHRLPELAMFGQRNLNVMKTGLNLLGNQLLDGLAATPGTRIDGVIDGYPVQLREVNPEWHPVLFGTALGFYRATAAVPFRQILWPDTAGVFPDEEGFPPQFLDRQPLLWLSTTEHPQGPWTAEV